MAELYAKPYEVIDTGYNPQQTQQGGQDAEMQSYLESLPPEERQKAIERINAPLSGEELALMAQSGQKAPTLQEYAEIEKYHKNQEISFIDGLGRIAEGGEQVMTDLSNAFASFLSDPKDATSKMPATAVEAFAQGTRNFYGMLAQSGNPDSTLFRVKDFLNGSGTIEDRYNQYMEALKFNKESADLAEGKMTMVMDKDMINHEVTQAMAYIADPTLFIPFGKVASTGLRAVGLGERLAMAGARSAAIKNGILGNTIKWGAGQPLEFMGGAVRNTIDYGLEKAGAALETTTGINAKEFAQTARMSGIGFSASAVAGYSIPFASTVSDAYIVGSSAKGFGEALTLVGETMKKNPFGRGVRSWAAESLKQAEKNGVALSPHAKGLLRTLDAVDPLFAYGWNGLESAAEGAMIGGGLGYLSGGEEGMYSGIGAGVALGAIGGTAGKMVADVTGGTNIARRAVQAKMTIEGQKVINPDKAMFFQGMQTAAKARGKDVDLVNSIIIGIDEVAPNFEFHALTPEQFEIEAKRKGFDPETGKFRETSALDVEFGGDRASKSKAMYVLRSVGADFVGNRQGFLDALKKASAKDSANPNKTASNIPLALRKYTDVAKTFEKLSKTQQEAILKEIDEQGTKAKELGGTTKLREFYDALTWSEAWTDSLVKKFESNREGARKDITDMLAQETDKKGKLTSKGRALTDKLRAEGFLDKEGKLLRERNLLQADLTLSQFEQNKGAVIGREADGKTHMYINLTRMGDETFPHELFHTIMRESPMKKYFTDSLISKLLGTVDKDGKLSRPAEVNIGQVQKFFKKYIDLTHRNDDGTLDVQASEAKFKLVQEALTEYQNAGSNKQISDKARGLLEHYSEEFGAYYFSHWLMGRNRNTLFFGGELKGIEGIVERTKDSFMDFWQSKISKTNPEFDFSKGLNASFDRSKGLGRIGAIDYYMRDMVRAASNANREAFRPDSMTLDNLRDFERSNGLRNLTTVDGNRRLNPREQVTQNIRLGKEAFKILSGVDRAMRTSKDVIDENGKQVITGRLSETELDALVKGGIVPRAWADKVNQGYAMLDGTISNIFSAGYLGKTEQVTDASYPRLTGKDVAFKNRKAVLFDVETKVKADGTFYTLFHTLDLAVIEQRGNHLWQNVEYRNLWNGDRASFEADFFKYISNASKASTDTKKVDSATLLETGDGKGGQRRDVLQQMAGMALQTGDAYKHQPIAVIPEGIRHSVTTFNIDGMTMPRVDSGARYDINMGNAHKFIRENWQPSEMKQEKTPSGTLMTHESGFKFSNLNGKTTAYTSAGRKIGTFNSIREAINAGKKEYNDIYKKHPLDIAKALHESEQKISRYQPLEPHERMQAFALGDVFKVPSVKKFIEGLPFLRQTREEFILDKAEKAIKGDPEKLWQLAQERAKSYEQTRDTQNKLNSEFNKLQSEVDSYYKERKTIEDTLNDIKNINSFGTTIPYNLFYPDYVLARYNRTSLKDNVALREVFKKYGVDYARHSDAYGQLSSPDKNNAYYEPFRKSLHDALNSQEFSNWYDSTTHSITLDITSGIGKNSFDLKTAEQNLLLLRGEIHKLVKKNKGMEGLERLFNTVQKAKDHVRYQSENNTPEGLRITEAQAFKNSVENSLQSSKKNKWGGILEELFASEYDANIQTGKPIVAIGTHGTRASAVMVSRMLLDERLGSRYTNAGSAYMGHFFASSQSTSSSYAENLNIKPEYFASAFINELSILINLYEKQNPIVIGDSKYERMTRFIDELKDANLKIGNGVYEWGRDALRSSSDAFLKDTKELRAKLEKVDESTPLKEIEEIKREIYKSYQKRIKGLVEALGQYSDATLDLIPYELKVSLPDNLNAFLDSNNTSKQMLGYLDRVIETINEGNETINEKLYKNTFLSRYNDLGMHEIKIKAKDLLERNKPEISIEKQLEERASDWGRIRTNGTNPFYKLIDSSVVKDSNLYLDKAFNEFMDKVYQIDKEFPLESLDDMRLLRNSENGKYLYGGKQIRSLIKLKNPKVVLDPRSYEEYHLYPHMEQAKQEGHDGIIFQKLDDGGSVQDTIFVVFKGNQENIKTIDTTADKEGVPRGEDENGEAVRYGKQLNLAFQPTDESETPKQIQGIKLDMTKAYDVFRREYEESTGQSWTMDKFMQRASNWQFFGDENGFVAVRPQRSGFVKLVGMAGDNKSKLRGIQQIQQMGLPVWGMVSKDIKDIAVKRGMREPNMIERTLLKQALNSAALGDAEILGYTPDNGVRLRYPDIGEVTKYMVGSQEYYQRLRSQFGDQIKSKIGFQPNEADWSTQRAIKARENQPRELWTYPNTENFKKWAGKLKFIGNEEDANKAVNYDKGFVTTVFKGVSVRSFDKFSERAKVELGERPVNTDPNFFIADETAAERYAGGGYFDISKLNEDAQKAASRGKADMYYIKSNKPANLLNAHKLEASNPRLYQVINRFWENNIKEDGHSVLDPRTKVDRFLLEIAMGAWLSPRDEMTTISPFGQPWRMDNWVKFHEHLLKNGYDSVVIFDNSVSKKAPTIVVPQETAKVKGSSNYGEFSRKDTRYNFQPAEGEKAPVNWAKEKYGKEGYNYEVIWMTPERFLNLAAPLGERANSEYSRNNIERLKLALKRSDHDMDMPHLSMKKSKNGELQVLSHEGRHRATAIKELYGDKKIPVLLVMDEAMKIDNDGQNDWHYSGKKFQLKPESERKKGTVSKEFKALEETPFLNELGTGKFQPAEGDDYRGTHKAPSGENGEGSLDAMDRTYPDDLYSAQGARFYGDGQPKLDKQMHDIIMRLRGKPDAMVTVYRAVPKGAGASINKGDWVTPLKAYAFMHGERWNEGADILEKKVKASELFTEGNSLYEFGWSPKEVTKADSLRKEIADQEKWIERSRNKAPVMWETKGSKIYGQREAMERKLSSLKYELKNLEKANKPKFQPDELEVLNIQRTQDMPWFRNLIAGGSYVRYAGVEELNYLRGLHAISHGADTLTGVDVNTVGGRRIVEGKGGLGYALNPNNPAAWASIGKGFINEINGAVRRNIDEAIAGGMSRAEAEQKAKTAIMPLVFTTYRKNLNSVQGSEGYYNLFEILRRGNIISDTDLRLAMTKAVEKLEPIKDKESKEIIGYANKQTNELRKIVNNNKLNWDEMLAGIFATLSDSEIQNFGTRASMADDFFGAVWSRLDLSKAKEDKIKSIFPEWKTVSAGRKITVEDMKTNVASITTDTLSRNLKSGDIYAILKFNDFVTDTESNHRSYNTGVIQENGQKPEILILKKPIQYSDFYASSVTSKGETPLSELGKSQQTNLLGMNARPYGTAKVKLAGQVDFRDVAAKMMPAEYTEFKSEQSPTGRILRNAKGYVIMLANNKFRVYNPTKAIIGVYGSEEEAKKRIYKYIPKQ